MTPVNCVAPAAPPTCPGAPATAPAVSASGASLPTGVSQREPTAIPNTDPVALLAEAVDQLRLAVAALQQNSMHDAKPADTASLRAKDDGAKDRRISALAEAIRQTQGDVGELLASRSFGPSAMASSYGLPLASHIATPASPFADASFSDAGGFFAEQTTEPDF